jgi:WD40 repeat protein
MDVLDDGRIASRNWDGSVDVYNPATREVQRIDKQDIRHRLPVKARDQSIVRGCTDGTVEIWNSDGHWEKTGVLGQRVRCLAVVGDGRMVSGGSHGQFVSEPLHPVKRVVGDGRVVSSAGAVPSGRHHGSVKVWDVTTGDGQSMNQHAKEVTCVAVLGDGRIASGSYDGTVKIWDPVSDTVMTFVIGEIVTEVAVSRKLRRIAVGTVRGNTYVVVVEPGSTPKDCTASNQEPVGARERGA